MATGVLSGLTLGNGVNIALGTGTGTKIGTATNEKLGFYNATPVVQRSAPATLQNVITALSDLGLSATGTAGLVHGDVAAANKDGVAGTPSLRTLGTGSTQACAGNDARLSDARAAAGQILDNGWVPALSAGTSTTYANVGTSPTRAIVLTRPSVVFAIWSFACAGSGVAGQELGVRYSATASAGPALAAATAFEQFLTLESGLYSAASLAGAWIVTVAATITVAVQYKIATGSAYVNSLGTASPVVYYAIPYS